MLPANQGFKAKDMPGTQRHLGLIKQNKLIFTYCRRNFSQLLVTLGNLDLFTWIVGNHGRFAIQLGFIHTLVSMAD